MRQFALALSFSSLLAAGAALAAGPPERERLPGLLRQLKEGNALARQDAVVALGEMGPRAEPAIPALVAALNDPRTQRLACIALGKIGAAAAPHLLAAALQDNQGLRDLATEALAGMGQAAVPVLCAALRHKDVRVREVAVAALTFTGKPLIQALPSLVRLLRATEPVPQLGWERYPTLGPRKLLRFHDPDELVRAGVAMALARMGPAGCAALLEVVEADADRPRLSRALSSLQDHPFSTLPFSPMLDATQERLRQQRMARLLALQALAFPFPASPGRAAVPSLIRLIKHPDTDVSVCAIAALGRIGVEARAATPALLAALEDDRSARPTSFAFSQSSVLWQATWALLSLGPEAKRRLVREGLPVLLEALEETDDFVEERQIINAIGLIGPEARSAVPALLGRLRGKDSDPLDAIASALSSIGPDLAVPLLLPSLRLDNPRAFQPVVVLAGLSPRPRSANPALLAMLRHANPSVRYQALRALPPPDARDLASVPRLIALVQDEYKETRTRAAKRLGKMGPSAKGAVPALRKALADEHQPVQFAAACALLEIEGNSKPALAKLVAELGKFDGSAEAASMALEALAPDLSEAVPELRKIIGDKDRAFSIRAIGLLAKAGPAFLKEAEKALIELLQRPGFPDIELVDGGSLFDDLEMFSPAVLPPLLAHFSALPHHPWGKVIAALPQMGPGARAALPLLARAVDDPGSPHRHVAALALGKFGAAAAPAVPSLMALLVDGSNPSERAAAAQALGQIGPAASRAIPRLRAAARDDAPRVRAWATFALARITRTEAELVRALLRDLFTPVTTGLVELYPTPEPAEVLAELGPDARAAIPVLAQALKSNDLAVRWSAASALGQIGPASAPATANLIAVLRGDIPALRHVAATSLGQIGPAARPALPHLRAVLAEEDDLAARIALRRIIARIAKAP